MKKITAAIWTLWVTPVILLSFVYSCRHRRFRRKLEALRRAASTIDANLIEIHRLRKQTSRRSDVIVAERTRREFEGVDFAALAERLHLR
jgi:cytochrome c-type biogenesis protein CcmH/NrfF